MKRNYFKRWAAFRLLADRLPVVLSVVLVFFAIPLVTVVLSVGGGAGFGTAYAKTSPQYVEAATTVALKDLPKQGQETYAKILSGGPFPYDKDGTVFGNREQLLPKHKRGYYLEYTVKTPYARNRGAKRIVCGSAKAPTAPEVCYYTEDHYSSFKKILP